MGPKTREVIERMLKAKDVDDALAILTEAGLSVSESETPAEETPAGDTSTKDPNTPQGVRGMRDSMASSYMASLKGGDDASGE